MGLWWDNLGIRTKFIFFNFVWILILWKVYLDIRTPPLTQIVVGLTSIIVTLTQGVLFWHGVPANERENREMSTFKWANSLLLVASLTIMLLGISTYGQ